MRGFMKSAFVMVVAAAVAMLSGCASDKNIVYLQDMLVNVSQTMSQKSNIVAQPGDRLAILVNCTDPSTAAMFALLTPNRTLDYNTVNGANTQMNMSYFQIGEDGCIDFPILGKVHVAGLTAPQIADKISQDLVAQKLVKDPVVVADFSNLHYSVMGEVKSPGQYPLANNRVTLMEALAAAGDMTIFGKRENVKVIREENGQRKVYQIDLRSNQVFDSPAYYLQQNDVVYVEPNKKKAGESSVTENQWRSPGLWISIASLLTTVGVLVFK